MQRIDPTGVHLNSMACSARGDEAATAGRATPTRSVAERIALATLGVVAAASSLLLTGCPADLENPERFMGASSVAGGNGMAGSGTVDTTCLTQVFDAKCGFSGCHAASTPAGGLDLASPGVTSRLVDVAATHVGSDASCRPAKLIDSANPSASWLLAKINGKQGAGCGLAMPIGTPLSAEDNACVTTFVNAASASAASAPSPTGAGGSGNGTSGATAGSGGS